MNSSVKGICKLGFKSVEFILLIMVLLFSEHTKKFLDLCLITQNIPHNIS